MSQAAALRAAPTPGAPTPSAPTPGAPNPVAPTVVDAFALAAERAGDARPVEALVDAAFGPGRYAKTAERVRERAQLRRELSVCAWTDGGVLAGAVRLWSVRVGEAPAVFLGPIAVAEPYRGQGLAARLVEAACEAARAAGETAVVLVGDLSRFGPMGFSPAPPGRVILPGPVDARRLLWRELKPGALDGLEGRLVGDGR